MKFKTTIILAGIFAVLLLFVLFIEKKPKDAAVGPEEKLVTLAAADIEKISLQREAETLMFQKNDQGEWTIMKPLETQADAAEVEALVAAFADLRIERVVEKENADPQKYEIPKREVALWVKGQAVPVRILLGAENALDKTFYGRKEGDPRIVLLPAALKSPLEKTFFDFRRKDIFHFETKDVQGIKLQAKDASWEVRKTEDGWMFSTPLKALAKESAITGLLDSLSGLKAKEFIAEAKTAAEIQKNGLDKPEYSVTLNLPAAGREIVFFLHKAADQTFVTTSSSTNIIIPETDILPDLDKKTADLREGKVAVFDAWQAAKLVLRKGSLTLTAEKSTNDKWYFDAGRKEEADGSLVETFIRKIESLEGAEFVDAPKSPAEFGLDKPQAEITIVTRDAAAAKPTEKAVTVVVGNVDKDKKQATVRNTRFPYLFKVDSSFLDEFPKDKKDWTAAPPAPAEAKK